MSTSANRCRRIVAWVMVALAAVAVYQAAVGCTTVIVPPADPTGAVSVYLLDHGHHAELVMPDGDGGHVAYVYGDWKYFALSRNDAWHGLLAVAVPTQGALGRRRVGEPLPAESVPELHVSEERVSELLARLDERFNAGIETRTLNEDYGLEFVKDPAAYIWFHNCNTVLAGWLEELGCDCRGPAWFADFAISDSET